MKSPGLAAAFLSTMIFAGCEKLSPPQGPDPTAAMAQMASELPLKTHFGARGLEFAYVSYDVRKTDSMVNPMVGYLNFTEINGPDFQYVFHWQSDHWVFDRMLCRNNGQDFTNLPGGIEIMNGGEMRPFLAKYGRITPEPPSAVQPRSSVKPISAYPQARTASSPTPSGAWMWENRGPLDQRPGRTRH